MSRVAIVDLKNKRTSYFAYSDNGCRATTKKDCKCCVFYKTKQQVLDEQAKSEVCISNKFGVPYKEFIEAKGLC